MIRVNSESFSILDETSYSTFECIFLTLKHAGVLLHVHVHDSATLLVTVLCAGKQLTSCWTVQLAILNLSFRIQFLAKAKMLSQVQWPKIQEKVPINKFVVCWKVVCFCSLSWICTQCNVVYTTRYYFIWPFSATMRWLHTRWHVLLSNVILK